MKKQEFSPVSKVGIDDASDPLDAALAALAGFPAEMREFQRVVATKADIERVISAINAYARNDIGL